MKLKSWCRRSGVDDPRWIAHIEAACRTYKGCDDSAIALASCDDLTVAGAAALLEYVASMEARDPETWPTDLVDDNDKRRTWHFFSRWSRSQ
jgi:hypothetical protein